MAVCAVSRRWVLAGYFGDLHSLGDLVAGVSLGNTRPVSNVQNVLSPLFPTGGKAGGAHVWNPDHLVEPIDSEKMCPLRESIGFGKSRSRDAL